MKAERRPEGALDLSSFFIPHPSSLIPSKLSYYDYRPGRRSARREGQRVDNGKPVRVLRAASEMAGFARTGGLGDVVAALPQALARRGHDCAVVLPLSHSARAARPA